jgi:hypothetical protein
MLSVNWKFIWILILSTLIIAATGVYVTQNQPIATISHTVNEENTPFSVMHNSENIGVDSERIQYKTIPLESLSSPLQGSDPATLALNVIEDMELEKGTPNVEVIYPQSHKALVKITNFLPNSNSVRIIKYRVEMNTFGRSLLVSSPLVWQITWAGSQIQCRTGSRYKQQLTQSKSMKCEV